MKLCSELLTRRRDVSADKQMIKDERSGNWVIEVASCRIMPLDVGTVRVWGDICFRAHGDRQLAAGFICTSL